MQTLSAIQEKVIQDAVKKLDAAGVSYAVVLPGGVKLGTLELAKPKLVKPEPKFRRKYKWGHMNLGDKVSAAKVGDVLTFPIEPGKPDDYPIAMLKAVGTAATKAIGKGNFTSMLNKKANQVEVLIMGQPQRAAA